MTLIIYFLTLFTTKTFVIFVNVGILSRKHLIYNPVSSPYTMFLGSYFFKKWERIISRMFCHPHQYSHLAQLFELFHTLNLSSHPALNLPKNLCDQYFVKTLRNIFSNYLPNNGGFHLFYHLIIYILKLPRFYSWDLYEISFLQNAYVRFVSIFYRYFLFYNFTMRSDENVAEIRKFKGIEKVIPLPAYYLAGSIEAKWPVVRRLQY